MFWSAVSKAADDKANKVSAVKPAKRRVFMSGVETDLPADLSENRNKFVNNL